MLSTKQKSYLRKLAHTRKALFQIGKDDIGNNLIKTVDDSLTAHELVKISLLKTCSFSVEEAAIHLASATHSEIVQTIGRTFVLYRRSSKNRLEL